MSDDLNLDTKDENDDKENASASGSNKLVLIVAILGSLLIGGGAVWFLKGESTSPDTKTVEAKQTDEIKAKAIFIPIAGDIVVNIGQESPHNMVVKVSLMTRNDETANAIKKHKPLIKNALLELFEEQDYKKLQSLEGKKGLRTQSLLKVKEVLTKQSESSQVEAILFTNFMME